jgi:putative ABC transport system permease protein
MSTLLQDLRYGFRLLLKNRGIAAISVLTLALGIGLTTTMFSIVYGALLRGLPFEESEQLMSVTRNNVEREIQQMGVTIHDLEAYREQQQVFEGLGAYYTGTMNVSGSERAERYDGGFVSANLFEVLRVRPALGRGFLPGEDLPGAAPVVVIGHELWRDRFGGDPQVIGRTLRANGVEREIVGVMPAGFRFPVNQALWLPHGRDGSSFPRGEGMQYSVVGRLRPGVSVDQASVQLAGIARRLAEAYPETNEGVGAVVQPVLHEYIPREPRALLYTMLGAVFFVLLIACVNVANLLLGQGMLRMKEVGIRSALGASRARVVMQFLTEPFAMALAGALLGTALAWWGVRLFVNSIADTNPPYWLDFSLDGTILLFVLGLTLFVTLAAGLLPALRVTSGEMGEILKDETRGSSSFRVGKLTRGLVIFEVALSCGLLVAAGLMVKSIGALRSVDFGFDPAPIFTARVGVPEAQYPDTVAQIRFFEELTRELGGTPQLQQVALSDSRPGLGSGWSTFAVEGEAYATDREMPSGRLAVITPGFFEVLGAGLLQGRGFGAQDTERSLQVAVANESFVRRHFPDGDAVGRRVRLGDSRSERPWLTIVGVAPDLYMDGIQNENPHGLYVPLTQQSRRFMTVLARGPADPMTLAPLVRDAVARVDADVPIYFVETLQSAIAQNTWFFTVFGSIFMIMGAVALFLAGIGLYGVMAFSVSRRTREMGVRMALGASARDVLRLVLRQGAVQLAVGLTVGLLMAAGLSQLLSELLFQVTPRDPVIFGSIALLLAGIGVLASWVPARRATRVDPMVALRNE